jgi:two-component system phosphate regulon sensor histidine kinase PhoR
MPFKRGLRRKTKSLPKTARLEHERLTSLINSMADAVIAVDEDVKVVLYNAAALNIFDINNIKVGSDLGSLFKPLDHNDRPREVDAMVKAADRPVTSRDLRLKYADGSLINLYISIAPVHLGYASKGDRGYVLLLRDITHEKSLEEERDEFISVVSHELRTPIAVAEGNIGNAQFIASKSGDMDAIKQSLKEAHEQVLFLADMVNDLSTLSRAERGKLHVEVAAIDVKGLVEELASNYQKEAAAKGLKLEAEVAVDVKPLHSSELYVREILQNFITNALKYTHQGEIDIKAAVDPKGVRFTVRDTGIGISKADQERIFDKFFRSEDFRTREASGTGLGLYVTLKLTHLIHAEISLDSELNKGSTFTILIPELA